MQADTTGMARTPADSLHRTTSRILRQLSGAIAVLALSPAEEAFFREGEQLSEATGDFRDLDLGYRKPSLWQTMKGWLRGERTQYAE